MNNFRFREALKICLELSSEGNLYVQTEKPWDVVKTDPARTKVIIGTAINYCWTIMRLLLPFIPKTATKILLKIQTRYTLRKDLKTNGEDVHANIGEIELKDVQISLASD